MGHLVNDAAIWVAVLGFVFSLINFAVRRRSADRSVNNAIFAEMHRVREAIGRHREFWQGRMEQGATKHHPLIPFAHLVYDSQIQNVGVVDRRHVDEVVRFFGFVDYINRFQALRPHYAAAGHEEEFNGMYVRLLSRLLDGKS